MPQPGVPESFKVLVKELQSLCLDVRVLDEEGQEIELKNDDDDDDFRQGFRDEEVYASDDKEIESSGYTIEDIEEEADEDFIDDYEDSDDDDLVELLDDEDDI